jgi:hypothetical protein
MTNIKLMKNYGYDLELATTELITGATSCTGTKGMKISDG